MADPHPRAGEAEQLINSPLLREIMSDIERKANERAISAHLSDDETRLTSLCEVRAIRSVRSQLEGILKPPTKAKRAGSPV